MELNKVIKTIGDHPVKDLRIAFTSTNIIVGRVSNKFNPNCFEITSWKLNEEGTYADSLMGEWFDLDLE